MKEKGMPKVTPSKLDNVGTNPKGKDPLCLKPKEPKKSWGLCAETKVSTRAQSREDKLGVTCSKKHS
jgi:hypothetical protein